MQIEFGLRSIPVETIVLRDVWSRFGCDSAV
jgi:hypothetical protein